MDEQQEIETLSNEEALIFAQYLRSEINMWNPRLVQLESERWNSLV